MTDILDAPSIAPDNSIAPEPRFGPPSEARPKPVGRPKGSKANPAGSGPDKSLVRKIASTTLGIESSSAARREMLTSLLGLRRNADTVAIVVATSSADSAAAAPVISLLNIAGKGDDMEAVVTAVELAEDRDAAKAVWSVLTAMSTVSGSLPPVAAKAGGAIAKAARSLTKADAAELGALRDLLR